MSHPKLTRLPYNSGLPYGKKNHKTQDLIFLHQMIELKRVPKQTRLT